MQTEKRDRKDISFIIKLTLGAVFFIAGLNFSYSAYFNEFPLFGVPFLAEIIISFLAAFFGYSLLPKYMQTVKSWVEELVSKNTNKLVNDFWNEYMSKMEENRKLRRKKKKGQQKKELKEKIKNGILLDTSMLIDGRILEVAKSGFLHATLVIPKSVINELHLLSDNKNDLKRKKGRRGLDVIGKLRKETKIYIFNLKDESDNVDQNLLQAAKDYNLKIMTLDFNLNKVAKASNLKVLNLNDLVEALKPEYIPGERLNVKIVHKGKEPEQGLGYLSDGTMVVVENGLPFVESEVEVEVIKLIQTSAGKMIFADVKLSEKSE